MRIVLLRHGMTDGNRHKRYIGVTDEPLCEEGRQHLREPAGITPDLLFVSPLIRCRETAAILFPEAEQIVIDNLAEMNFGIFENRSWEEGLSESLEYQKWLDSYCEDPIPGGESKEAFSRRCLQGFSEALRQIRHWQQERCDEHAAEGTFVFVVHGGTIMSVLSSYGDPERPYYEWKAENGHGYEGIFCEGKIREIREI